MSFIATVDFPNGEVVHLVALHAQATYAHHLEGPHTRRSNDGRIRRFREKANTMFGEWLPVLVLEPSRTVGRVIDGYQDDGQPVRSEYLPTVCCIGEFAGGPAAGLDGCASGLIIIWFQEPPPPLPLEADIADMFSRLDWAEHAVSYWY